MVGSSSDDETSGRGLSAISKLLTTPLNNSHDLEAGSECSCKQITSGKKRNSSSSRWNPFRRRKQTSFLFVLMIVITTVVVIVCTIFGYICNGNGLYSCQHLERIRNIHLFRCFQPITVLLAASSSNSSKLSVSGNDNKESDRSEFMDDNVDNKVATGKHGHKNKIEDHSHNATNNQEVVQALGGSTGRYLQNVPNDNSYSVLLARDGFVGIADGDIYEYDNVGIVLIQNSATLEVRHGTKDNFGDVIWQSNPNDISNNPTVGIYSLLLQNGDLVTYGQDPDDGKTVVVWNSNTDSGSTGNYFFALSDDKRYAFISKDSFQNAVWVEATTLNGGPQPVPQPIPQPVAQPTDDSIDSFPTNKPSITPTYGPTYEPTDDRKSESPTNEPTLTSSDLPSHDPSVSREPSRSFEPSASSLPSSMPSTMPSVVPSTSIFPSALPSLTPSDLPSSIPSAMPSSLPSISSAPSIFISSSPSGLPTVTVEPSRFPSIMPSEEPTIALSLEPTLFPSIEPTTNPTITPMPTQTDSSMPSSAPSKSEPPSSIPSSIPSDHPSTSALPTVTSRPSGKPSLSEQPSITIEPSVPPSTGEPSLLPSRLPSHQPTISQSPSNIFSQMPTNVDSSMPSSLPSLDPTLPWTPLPSSLPSLLPTILPTELRTLSPTFDYPLPDTSYCVNPSSSPYEYYFPPLHCNLALYNQKCSKTWNSMFGRGSTHINKLVIPCGECVVMDYIGPTLNLLGGLDIQGKLYIPPETKLTIEAPYIYVQGVLQIISKKIVNGEIDLKFFMKRTLEDKSNGQLVPHTDNSFVGCGTAGCEVGEKAIVVAGGRVDIRGLLPGTPAWLPLYDYIDSNHIVVDNAIIGKWGAGAEILITSHTLNYDDEQLTTIVSIVDHTVAGYAVIEVNPSITRPSTYIDNPDYATEVALLSRNIRFEGAKELAGNETVIGGHFFVYGTPNVQQHIEGIESINFGQQGRLGRYPFHFHLCGDVCGSIMTKNVVRESNQRCYIVHGTHNLQVFDNIAYNNVGHCFMTEDGNEEGNIFQGNLGALTKVPGIVIDGESDDEPSLFWITNPSNSLIHNVAAGSEFSGIWYELRGSVRGPSQRVSKGIRPIEQPLTLFRDNIAHSNGGMGLRTYPGGMISHRKQAVFENFKSYRNKEDGVFTHLSWNLAFKGGVFADNRMQIDVDEAQKILITDAKIIGVSPEYKKLIEERNAPNHCKNNNGVTKGIELHSYTRQNNLAPIQDDGTVLEGITFSGFADSGCQREYPIVFDDKTLSKNFDFYNTIKNLTFENGISRPISFCNIEDEGVDNTFIVDLDGSLAPSETAIISQGTSALVSISEQMMKFIDVNKCVDVPNRCLSYCQDTCLRGVTYEVDPSLTEQYKLRVCLTGTNNCLDVGGHYYPKDSQYSWFRAFGLALPAGSYDAVFLDNNNQESWPTFVQEVYEKKLCENSLEDYAVNLKVPTPKPGECENLIRNGDLDESSVRHPYWFQRGSGIELSVGKGIRGTNAMTDIFQTADSDSLVQFLDTRCLALEVGSDYEIEAWVRLEDNVRGGSKDCIDDTRCPSVRLYGSEYETGSVVYQDSKVWSQSVAYLNEKASKVDGYFQIKGKVRITERVANTPNVYFSIRRNRKDVSMYVDNVSMWRVPTRLRPRVTNAPTGPPTPPTNSPSLAPTYVGQQPELPIKKTRAPSRAPYTVGPTPAPITFNTLIPKPSTQTPTPLPTIMPTPQVTSVPTTTKPTPPPLTFNTLIPKPTIPTIVPTPQPTIATTTPTPIPTAAPTPIPTATPTPIPTMSTIIPTNKPSSKPSMSPSTIPTTSPSETLSMIPTTVPTDMPINTRKPVEEEKNKKTLSPTVAVSSSPSTSALPTIYPSSLSSQTPSIKTTTATTSQPTTVPPTTVPPTTNKPTTAPPTTISPTRANNEQPTNQQPTRICLLC